MPQLQPGMARIRVKDLRLRTFIGINEDEILNKQDVLINLTILYAAQEAVRDNDIDHALNYRTITKAIIAMADSLGLKTTAAGVEHAAQADALVMAFSAADF